MDLPTDIHPDVEYLYEERRVPAARPSLNNLLFNPEDFSIRTINQPAYFNQTRQSRVPPELLNEYGTVMIKNKIKEVKREDAAKMVDSPMLEIPNAPVFHETNNHTVYTVAGHGYNVLLWKPYTVFQWLEKVLRGHRRLGEIREQVFKVNFKGKYLKYMLDQRVLGVIRQHMGFRRNEERRILNALAAIENENLRHEYAKRMKEFEDQFGNH